MTSQSDLNASEVTPSDDSKLTKSDEYSDQAHDMPSRAAIKKALTAIRPQGLQNLVAIPKGRAPIGQTFDGPPLRDFRGADPVGAGRDAGAFEASSM